MNCQDVVAGLEDAIEKDSLLNHWCEVSFGKLPNIMIGYDSVKPPLKGAYPLIILFDINADSESVAAHTTTRHIAVSCGIHNEEVLKEGRKIKFTGMVQVESFREQISQAIFRKFLGKIKVKPLGTESVFPLFASGMNISVESSYKINLGG